MPTPYLETPASPYAGFWTRVGAALIDGIVLLSVVYLVGVVIGFESLVRSSLFEEMEGSVDYQLAPLGSVLAGLLILFYKAMSESSHLGATPGKRVMKLEVTSTSGLPLGFWWAVLRSAPAWAPWLVPVPAIQWLVGILALSSCVSVVKNERRQGWHDRLAAALVVRRGTRFRSNETATGQTSRASQ